MRVLKHLWKRWLTIAKIIGNFQAQIVFTLFYFLILWIVGIIVRLTSDPLHLKKKSIKSNFILWQHPVESLEQAGKQY